jgi:cell division protein FtsB
MTRFFHATQQAPWRTQRQWIGAFLLIVLATVMVAALYLNVTARAAILGREVQTLRTQIAETERANADLETRLATLMSTSELERRALALGFRPVDPDEVIYIVVPGYRPPGPVNLASQPRSGYTPPPMLPEYNQSLLEWFQAHLLSTPGGAGGQR